MSGAPLTDFHKSGHKASVPLSSKVMAAALTAGVYAVIAVMTSQHGTYTPPRRPQPSQVLGVMAPVLAPDRAARQPSRLSWFLAEPPSVATSSAPSSSCDCGCGFAGGSRWGR